MVDQQGVREAAVKRLKARRDFRMHLGTYLIISAMMVAIWALSARTHFWLAWVIVFWGVALAFHGWWAHFGQPISEADIHREMGNGR